MAYSREIPGFTLTIESEKPFEDLPQTELAQITFLKAIEGAAVMVLESFDVTEADLCVWLRDASDVVKERSLKKED